MVGGTFYHEHTMSDEIIIANPIYDVVFKRLMEDTENARYFIKTLLDEDVVEVQLKPQEVTLPTNLKQCLTGQDAQLPGALTVLRLDFVATIRTASGEYKKVLIEVQKGKKNLDVMRFRNYLAEHYQQATEITTIENGKEVRKNLPLHIISIYILGFKLPHITTPAVKITREYIDLITKQPIDAKEDFVEQLTHDSIIIQTTRIHGTIKTELEALLSIFEQDYFVDPENEHLKRYPQVIENESLQRLTRTLAYIGSSPEDRKAMNAEESVRRVVEGDFDEATQMLRAELVEKDGVIAEKDNALAEKDSVIAEKNSVIAEKDKELAELRAKLSSVKR